MSAELEDKFQELIQTKGVRGVLILNSEGSAIKSSFDPKGTESLAETIHEVKIPEKINFNV